MPLTIALTLGAGLLVGLVVGLLGGGGSILTVPLLIYLAGIPPKPAITASLFVVAATSLAGLVPHALAGRVRWRTGLLFAGTGMVGAYLGGRVAGWLPAPLLLGIFAAMMAAASIVMLRSPRHRPGTRSAGAEGPWSRRFIRRVAILAGQGFAVGVFTGLVGAGGGFMIVPALAVFGGLSMPAAVGTSLLVLTLQSLAGLGGHLHDSSPPWP
ncbi:MAG: sulfite exporter TauE/SafE family protein, partial [Micromonosporaceae bacterium]|nr:sulfite exporter TauE/SafE family protein [Micromonosporaceae bacterium]